MIVRGAAYADAAAIARVHVVTWREVYAALLPAAIMETNTEERRRALLGTLAEALAQDGRHALALHVVAQNPARRFYEHLGARFLHEEALAPGVDEGTQCAYGWSDLRSVPTGSSQWTVQPRGGEPQPDCT